MAETARAVLANLGAVLLLMVAFLLLGMAAVALFMTWRVLPRLQLGLRELAPQLQKGAQQIEASSRAMAHAVIDPQIRIASRAAGLRAGIRAFFAGGSG